MRRGKVKNRGPLELKHEKSGEWVHTGQERAGEHQFSLLAGLCLRDRIQPDEFEGFGTVREHQQALAGHPFRPGGGGAGRH